MGEGDEARSLLISLSLPSFWASSSSPTLHVGDFDQAQCLRIWIVGQHLLDSLDPVS